MTDDAVRFFHAAVAVRVKRGVAFSDAVIMTTATFDHDFRKHHDLMKPPMSNDKPGEYERPPMDYITALMMLGRSFTVSENPKTVKMVDDDRTSLQTLELMDVGFYDEGMK